MAVVRVNALFKKKAAAPAKKAKAPAKKKAAAPARKAKKAAPGKGEGNTLFGGLQDMLSTNADTLESRARSGSNAIGAQRYGGHDPHVHHGPLLFPPANTRARSNGQLLSSSAVTHVLEFQHGFFFR